MLHKESLERRLKFFEDLQRRNAIVIVDTSALEIGVGRNMSDHENVIVNNLNIRLLQALTRMVQEKKSTFYLTEEVADEIENSIDFLSKLREFSARRFTRAGALFLETLEERDLIFDPRCPYASLYCREFAVRDPILLSQTGYILDQCTGTKKGKDVSETDKGLLIAGIYGASLGGEKPILLVTNDWDITHTYEWFMTCYRMLLEVSSPIEHTGRLLEKLYNMREVKIKAFPHSQMTH